MRAIVIGVLILGSSIVQLSYADPLHRGEGQKSNHRRQVQNPLDQDNWLGGTGNWSDGGKWSLNSPPGSGDDATIGSAGDFVHFNVGTATINSLTLDGELTDDGIASQLTLSSFLNVTSTGILDFSASSINLPGYMQGSTNYGKISAAGLSIGTSTMGGYFDNYGVVNVGGLGIARPGGQFRNEASATLTTTAGASVGDIENYGQWDNSGAVSGGYPYGSVINNYGVLNNHSSGTIHISYQDSIFNYGTFTNDGSVTSDFLRGGGSFGNSGTFTNNGTAQLVGFGNSGSIVNTGTFTIGLDRNTGGGENTGTGNYVQNGAQSSTILEGTFTTSTPLQFNGGLLTGSGIIVGDVNMSGTLHPGDGINGLRAMNIQGNYKQFGIGTLHSELGGTQAGQDYDQLGITGNAALDGTLDVLLTNNFTPKLGDTFFLLTYGSESGAFSTLDLPSLPSGEAWDYAYESSDFKLWVAPVPEPSSLILLGSGLLGLVRLRRRKLF